MTNLTETNRELENKIEVFSLENIETICKLTREIFHDQEIMVVVGSKKIRFENAFSQECEFTKYMLVYILLAFKLLNKGGSLVLRTYDINLPFTCGLLYILYQSFDQITIIKPLTSNIYSGVRD